MASSDSRLNYVPAPQPALSQSACLALSLTKSNKVFGGTGILKWIHLYRFPGGQRHLLEDKTQSTVHYQPWRSNWIINLWEVLKLRKQRCFLSGRGHISGKAANSFCPRLHRDQSLKIITLHTTPLQYSTPYSPQTNNFCYLAFIKPLFKHISSGSRDVSVLDSWKISSLSTSFELNYCNQRSSILNGGRCTVPCGQTHFSLLFSNQSCC